MNADEHGCFIPACASHHIWLETPLGPVRLVYTAHALVGLHFLQNAPRASEGRPGLKHETPLAARARQALQDYFARPGQAMIFDLPCAPAGTAFQRRVWRRLQAIPYGEVMTYGALARELGSSARAVGNACRRNPLPLVIPCHRVVAARGIGGYAGATAGRWLAIKRFLLRHEGGCVS